MIVSTMVLIAALEQASAAVTASVVFVCEHGAAKSVVATAYFNKLAAERGLPFRAAFRGAGAAGRRLPFRATVRGRARQDNLSVRAVEGLKADGVAIPSGKPTAIGDADV